MRGRIAWPASLRRFIYHFVIAVWSAKETQLEARKCGAANASEWNR